MLTRRMGLNFTTPQTNRVKVNNTAHHNFTLKFFQHLGYSWQISRPMKLPASGVRAAELSYFD